MRKQSVILVCLALIIFGCGKAKDNKQSESLLPTDEKDKVVGTGFALKKNYLADIYNGSSWTITRVVLTIVGVGDEPDKLAPSGYRDIVLWKRDFCAYPSLGRIRPLTTETCLINLPDDCHCNREPLRVKEVYGYKPQ